MIRTTDSLKVPPAVRCELVDAVQGLADAIASGEVTPAPGELAALAVACDLAALPAEAARVRRWMAAS